MSDSGGVAEQEPDRQFERWASMLDAFPHQHGTFIAECRAMLTRIVALDLDVAAVRADLLTTRRELDEAEHMIEQLTGSANVYKGNADQLRAERDALKAALTAIRSIGAASGTNINAMNEIFDVIDDALPPVAAAMEGKTK